MYYSRVSQGSCRRLPAREFKGAKAVVKMHDVPSTVCACRIPSEQPRYTRRRGALWDVVGKRVNSDSIWVAKVARI
jgi:hypothetical protein